jgi:hypothetical protein
MTIGQITSLIAAHTHGLATVESVPVEASFEVRMHEAKMVRQERFNDALDLR